MNTIGTVRVVCPCGETVEVPLSATPYHVVDGNLYLRLSPDMGPVREHIEDGHMTEEEK